VVFIFEFHVGHDLSSYIGGSAFWTSHNNYLLFVLFLSYVAGKCNGSSENVNLLHFGAAIDQ
jgi:hypothetical protein